MKTKTIEDYYCTSIRDHRKVHITNVQNIRQTLCKLYRLTYQSLEDYLTYDIFLDKIFSYKALCKTCIKRLPDNVREEVIYNYVLAKVKK